ncbi:hypothetical protein ACH5RR_011748 [Cinchona calisaya]|uniref:non-specific serine/threonine protein kinase n=1 Tax=Cinchona calisaya TaxID=153742 RepID=A0ABD3A8C6_9GENT
MDKQPEDSRLPPGSPVDMEKKYNDSSPSPSDSSPPAPPPPGASPPSPSPDSSPPQAPPPAAPQTPPPPPPPPPPPTGNDNNGSTTPSPSPSPPPPPAGGSNSPPPPTSSSPSPPPPKSPTPSSSPPSPQPPSPPPPPSGTGTPPSPSAPASANNSSPPPSGSANPVLPPGVIPPPPAPEKPTPPSRGIPAPQNSPSSSSGSRTSNSPPSSGSSPANHTAIITGVAVAGAMVVAFLFVWLVCTKKKKKQLSYMDPGRPPKGTDAFYSGPPHLNNQNPAEYVFKIPTPSGGAVGGFSGSGEFNSGGFLGHNHAGIPPPSPGLGGFSKSQFSYEELAGATSGFSQANLLGQGGFGYVHKGVLPDGREVAVKSLKSGSGQGEREFQAEVEIISRVHHRHLVSLVGYCIAEGQRMLVYEFVPNKTLECHLYGKGQPVMDWGVRLRIALGSAKGLAYLHEDCYPKIIHRDIKAANILLDDKFEAMVADFGLAKLSSDNYTHVSTRVMGTFGYMAPEYASSGKLTEKSDVFSFGVMLLELITGRRPVDLTNNYMEDSLVDWARPLLATAMQDGNYNELVDPRLEGNYVPHEMSRMIACAAASIRHSARRRPKMSQIVHALEGDSSLEDLNEGGKQKMNGAFGLQSGNIESQAYNTGMYNADMNKFRKMVMDSQEYNSSEFGATSEYGLNPSSSSSDSREFGTSDNQKPKI